MPSTVIIIVIDFMFLGINIFWALLRAHFNPRLTARAKMSLSRAQNIFMPASRLYCFIIRVQICTEQGPNATNVTKKKHWIMVKDVISSNFLNGNEEKQG